MIIAYTMLCLIVSDNNNVVGQRRTTARQRAGDGRESRMKWISIRSIRAVRTRRPDDFNYIIISVCVRFFFDLNFMAQSRVGDDSAEIRTYMIYLVRRRVSRTYVIINIIFM